MPLFVFKVQITTIETYHVEADSLEEATTSPDIDYYNGTYVGSGDQESEIISIKPISKREEAQ